MEGGLENFILFITNRGFRERWGEVENLCYEWVHWGFEVDEVKTVL